MHSSTTSKKQCATRQTSPAEIAHESPARPADASAASRSCRGAQQKAEPRILVSRPRRPETDASTGLAGLLVARRCTAQSTPSAEPANAPLRVYTRTYCGAPQDWA